MGRIRLTLHGSQLRNAKLTLEQKAALAQKYGYAGLDFTLGDLRGYAGGDPAQVRALFARCGVEPSTAGGLFPADLVGEDSEFAAAIEQLPAKARAAAATGAARTGTVLRPRATRPMDVLWPVVVERLHRIDRALAGTGIRMGVEFLGVKTSLLDRPHVFVNSMDEANQLLNESGVEHVGLTLDSYHWYTGGGTLDAIRTLPAERIVLLHINDAKPGPREQLMDNERVLPGEGVIPLAEWLQAIAATGFDGFVGMEVIGARLADIDAEACAGIGIERLRPVFEAAGLAMT